MKLFCISLRVSPYMISPPPPGPWSSSSLSVWGISTVRILQRSMNQFWANKRTTNFFFSFSFFFSFFFLLLLSLLLLLLLLLLDIGWTLVSSHLGRWAANQEYKSTNEDLLMKMLHHLIMKMFHPSTIHPSSCKVTGGNITDPRVWCVDNKRKKLVFPEEILTVTP